MAVAIVDGGSEGLWDLRRPNRDPSTIQGILFLHNLFFVIWDVLCHSRQSSNNPIKQIVRFFSHKLNTGKPKPRFKILIDLLHLHLKFRFIV
jgi:hypothetical protein